MRLKAVLIVLSFINSARNVEGKAVGKRIKRTAYSGSSYSYNTYPQYNAYWAYPAQNSAENSYWYKYPESAESNHQYYASNSKLNELAESNPHLHSNANHDLESYGNLKMVDSEFSPEESQNSHLKSSEENLHSNIQQSKESDGPLESDQEKDKMSKYSSHKVKQDSPKNHQTVHSKGKEKSKSSISKTPSDLNTRKKNKMSKYSNHKAKQDSPKGHQIVHSKGKGKSKNSISKAPSNVNTESQRNVQSTMSPTLLPTTSQQNEVARPSDKLTFGLIPSDLIHETSENMEFNKRNLLPEGELDILDLSGSDESNVEDVSRAPVSNNFALISQENQLGDNGNFDSVINTEDKHLFKIGINQMFETNFDSFVFNPSAGPLEKFQECSTPKNESGSCRYVQHCMLPSILSSIQHFMDNVCIIEGRFIGVCCPEFPVETLEIKWEDQIKSGNDSAEIPQDCGIGTNTRIVGGNDADRKAWPWMVALLNNKKKFFCGGSLINNQYVLTAAHCTFGTSKNQIVARLGEYDFNDPREPHDDYRVVEMKRHGQYDSRTLRNDIALLKLEKPVVFNEFVKTICFPESAKDYVGNVSTLVGWGHLNGVSGGTSDVLQEASFPVITNDECSKTHRLPIPPSLICAAAVSGDKGACNGDSGGPLMLLDENNRWKVIGLVSWGRRGCSPKFPTVYTRITHFMDWIKQHST